MERLPVRNRPAAGPSMVARSLQKFSTRGVARFMRRSGLEGAFGPLSSNAVLATGFCGECSGLALGGEERSADRRSIGRGVNVKVLGTAAHRNGGGLPVRGMRAGLLDGFR